VTATHSPYCTVCHTAALYGARATFTVCQACVDWIDHHLDQVERLWVELPDHLERGRGHSGPRVSGNTKTSGDIPSAEQVLNLIGPGGVHDKLSTHDVAIRQARGLIAVPASGSADHRLSSTLRSLRAHLGWATANYDCLPLANELRTQVNRMRSATGAPTSRTLGKHCPRSDGDTECGGTLRYDLTDHTLACDDCGHELDTVEYLRLALA
jgi:N-acetyl-beta-hexosaminidase